MTVHVSGRSISALLLLSVSLLGLPAEALAQSVVTPQKAAPTLAERLDRLAAEFDRNRIDLHVPGAVLAIVRGEEVIFARGFGVADIGRKTPVTPDTPFLRTTGSVQVERVEAGAELAPDTFTLEPSAASVRKR